MSTASRGSPGGRRGDDGQAALEVVAAVPLVILAALVAWQLVAVVGAGLRAQERARSGAIERAAGGERGVITITETISVPTVLPGLTGLSIDARAVVRVP